MFDTVQTANAVKRGACDLDRLFGLNVAKDWIGNIWILGERRERMERVDHK